MRYTLEYPSELPTASDDFLQAEAIREIADGAEKAGFAAIALSEHPAHRSSGAETAATTRWTRLPR